MSLIDTNQMSLPQIHSSRHFPKTGTFPCIKVDLQLDRDLAFYTNLIYIPAIFVIIAAWVITLVDKTHAAARATVGK